ncbi:hypothetical protein F5882DRAFT_161952 [Hyaloscypha sp. PMI_1271]|nr:hypothetical protein F5882DRAFT_161952 [Hyaloscypha sp. PMI_1271]
MATQVAAVRQPFAPLNGSRLQNLTSLKNRQNALSAFSSPSKRKASAYEADNDNSENIDPIIFLSPKRSKNPDGSSKELLKPQNFFLTKAPPSPNEFSSLKPVASPRRPILPARSPAPRLDTSRSTPLSAPAGRSPTRKRIGITNRRKTGSPFTRVDPPKFTAPSSGPGFSIDAALSGTIPSYTPRERNATASSKEHPIPLLHQPEAKDSWFFDIHEDTEEELATNLMEHSTCTLDISSDEESRARERDCRGKENVPPPDDISQTRTYLSSSSSVEAELSMHEIKARIRASRKKREVDEGACDVDRAPLGDLAAEDFYADGCDGESVFLVPAEASEEEEQSADCHATFDFIADLKGKGKELDVDTLMSKDGLAPKAKLLEPIEKAEEGFELWESGSAKDGE